MEPLKESRNLKEVPKKASESSSPHTCISEEVQKTTGKHFLCWKRRSQGGRTLQRSSPWSPNDLTAKYNLQTGKIAK
jgi:hypothetical protein